MKFISTRDIKGDSRVSAAFAIKQGLAPDGGLYVPEYIPQIDESFVTSLLSKTYPEKAAEILCETAKKQGSTDDITAIVVKVRGEENDLEGN